jgi:hypothetical protein
MTHIECDVCFSEAQRFYVDKKRKARFAARCVFHDTFLEATEEGKPAFTGVDKDTFLTYEVLSL